MGSRVLGDVPLAPEEVDGGIFGRILPPTIAPPGPPRTAPLPRTPRRPSSSPEGTLGSEAEPVEYHEHQHETWARLCGLQRAAIRDRCAPAYSRGRGAIGPFCSRIPALRELDRWLFATTGWHVVRADGYVEPLAFLELLAHQRFPCMDLLRHADEIFYSPEPDMYHDILGHLPMLCDEDFAEYYLVFGIAGKRIRHAEQVLALNRIYWFTMEFGLVKSDREPLAYGAALLTGLRELETSNGRAVKTLPFSVDAAIATPTDIRKVNEVLYVAESFECLITEFIDWAKSERLL